MADSRLPGRYNLHRLGWSAFEDLCMQVMRVVLGETCTRFRPGPDGGRDGWFRGKASALLLSQNKVEGEFVIQCKHTSSAGDALAVSQLKTEIEKVRIAAASCPFNYILMTNRQVSALNEKEIRQKFEAMPGVRRLLILSETWIEDTVDAHPRLMRLVPRLYGIGDLSQILSHAIQQQTIAVLEDLTETLRTFVPTDSYHRAERALEEHGFVVLVGPPASGKSAIAANLCMVSMAQDPKMRVLHIERADQFKDTWSPADAHTIYWVDDVFGETTLDEDRLKEWSSALAKVEAARKRGSSIIFCTRDYILTAAEAKLKRAKAELINDARVRVNVTDLSHAERDGILYNHIKDGDITKLQKRHLKPFLAALARRLSFSPELARRLGNRKFNGMLNPTERHLEAFFDHPVRHFRDIIHGLSAKEMAALSVCVLSNNSVPDPLPDDALAEAVLKSYGVSMQDVRDAFEMLDGSLVKRVRSGTAQTWQLHHPSMIEALQEELAAKSSRLVLYLESARIGAILRDTTTLAPEPSSRLVFLPESVYDHLVERLHRVGRGEIEAVASFLCRRASDKFLILVDAKHPEVLDLALACVPDAEGSDASPKLAIRLFSIRTHPLITEARREIVVEAIQVAVEQSGWSGFLDCDGLEEVVPGVVEAFVREQVERKFSTFDTVYRWYTNDVSSEDQLDSAIDAIQNHSTNLRRALEKLRILTDEAKEQLRSNTRRFIDRLEERRLEISEAAEQRADAMQDEWKERWFDERYQRENGRFADVDE